MSCVGCGCGVFTGTGFCSVTPPTGQSFQLSGTFPNTSSSISATQIQTVGATSGTGWTNSASSWAGKHIFGNTLGSTEFIINSTNINFNLFRGKYAGYWYTPPPPTCTAGTMSCFLEGALVLLANGCYQAIETIKPGQLVIGAFGEVNQVLGLDFVQLGDRFMYNINGEHDTADDHPHVSVDGKFYSPEPEAIYLEWGGTYPVIVDSEGTVEMWTNVGLNPGRVTELEEGIVLQTNTGGRLVKEIKKYRMPADTKLYNLVIGGSHTYTVNDYAVTGWPREDDFDYDTWTSVSSNNRALELEDAFD